MDIFMEVLSYVVIFIIGTLVGLDLVPKLFLPESTEYVFDDMEITYIDGSKELIQDIAEVEVGEKFVLMFDGKNNIKAIIPNGEVLHIKSIRKDVE